MSEKLTLPDGTVHQLDAKRCSAVAPGKDGVLKTGYAITTEKGNAYSVAVVITGVGTPAEKATVGVGPMVGGAVMALKKNTIADAAMKAAAVEADKAGIAAAKALKSHVAEGDPLLEVVAGNVARTARVAAAAKALEPLHAEQAKVAAVDLAEKIKASGAALAKLG